MSKQQISKQACAKYAKSKGRNMPQAHYLVALNVFIMKDFSVPEAEAQALAEVRKRYPGFVPVRAAA